MRERLIINLCMLLNVIILSAGLTFAVRLNTHRSQTIVIKSISQKNKALKMTAEDDSEKWAADHQYTFEGSKNFLINYDKWKVDTWREPWVDEGDRFLKFYRNGKYMCRINARDYNCGLIRAKRGYFPTKRPIIAVTCNSECGSWQVTRYFDIFHRKMRLMGTIKGEVGGPIFRDFDHDGIMEWVFDDIDYYQSYFIDYHVPRHFIVYKINKNGYLKKWQTLHNPKVTQLPNPVQEDY